MYGHFVCGLRLHNIACVLLFLSSSEVFVEVELARVICLTFSRQLHASLLIVTNSLFKEVGLALERDHVHPFERIFTSVLLRNTKLEEEAISDKLNVLVHQLTVHPDQLDR